MVECLHCGQKTVAWDADFDSDDYGYGENKGIIHECHCRKCGARITYFVPNDPEDMEDGDESEGS